MKFSNNEHATYGSVALKPQASCNLVLLQGGSRQNQPDCRGLDSKDASRAPRAAHSAVAAVYGFACEAAERIEPLPEPMARPCSPSDKQELAGVAACIGCIVFVLVASVLLRGIL